MAIAISLLALLATLYELHLQRIHNRKSLRPIAQIDVFDRKKLMYVHVQNSGVGPLIVDRLSFIKDGKRYVDIEDCLDLNPKTYMHMQITDAVIKVITPGSHLEVFSTKFDDHEGETEMAAVRSKLAAIRLKVEGRDIYDSKIVVERDLQWFERHKFRDDEIAP